MPQVARSDSHECFPRQTQATNVHKGVYTLIWHRAAGSCLGSPAQGHSPAWILASVTDGQERPMSVSWLGLAWLPLARQPSIAHLA